MASDPIIGIDLGTTNSVVALVERAGGDARVLKDRDGLAIVPSVVSFHPAGNVIIGAAAKQRRMIDAKNTVFSAKRLIGRSFRSIEVQNAIARLPYAIKEGPNQQPMIVTRAGEFAVPEISALVLDHMHTLATKALGRSIDRAVVTVPASFNDAQRSATATAGAIAGLTVVRVLNEPTAAALAYGHAKALDRTIAVYDYGGGTFDLTLLKLEGDVYEVLGTAGDSLLGGDDMDERLAQHMARVAIEKLGLDVRDDPQAMERLRAVAEQTKIELSRRNRAVVRVDELGYGPGGVALHLELEVSRDQFIGMVRDLIDKSFPICDEALKRAGLGLDKLTDVVLVGGSTKIPMVRELVASHFKKAPRIDLNPDEAVALGAALQAEAIGRVLDRGRTTTRGHAADDDDELSATTEPATTDSESSLTDPFDLVTGSYGERSSEHRTEVSGEIRLDTLERVEPDTSERVEPDTSERTFDGSAEPDTQTQTERGAGAPASGRKHDRRTTDGGGAPIGRVKTQRVATVDGLKPITDVIPTQPAARKPAVPTAQAPEESGAIDKQIVDLLPPVASAPRTTLPGTGGPKLRPQPPSGAPPGVRAAPTPSAPPPAAPRPAPTPSAPPPVAASRSQPISPPPRQAAPPPTIARQAPSPTAPPPRPAPTPSAPPPVLARQAPSPTAPPPRPAPTVLDVTPHTLGIGTAGGYCESLISRNARVPAEKKRSFTTSKNGQRMVRIPIFQGEHKRLDGNVRLGDLVLDGIEPRPRGESTIEVSFQLDASGMLHVQAVDARSGRSQQATLDLAGRQTPAEVAAARDRLRQIVS